MARTINYIPRKNLSRRREAARLTRRAFREGIGGFPENHMVLWEIPSRVASLPGCAWQQAKGWLTAHPVIAGCAGAGLALTALGSAAYFPSADEAEIRQQHALTRAQYVCPVRGDVMQMNSTSLFGRALTSVRCPKGGHPMPK